MAESAQQISFASIDRLRQDVATDEVRKASRSRAFDSPVPGEGRSPNSPADEEHRLSRKREALRMEGDLDHAVDPALNAQRLIRLAEVSTMIGLRRSAIYKYVSEGRFPAPIKVGIRSVRWKLADVLAWSRLSQGRDNGV